jgi:hypothetical protein
VAWAITITITLLTILSWTLFSSQFLITLKAILFIFSIICWAGSVFVIAWYGGKRYKSQKWVNETVAKAISDDNLFSVQFDEEKIFFVGLNFKAEYNWSIFSSYTETAECVYLFQAGRSFYECTSFSKFEIGFDNLERLKQLVKTKLPNIVT